MNEAPESKAAEALEPKEEKPKRTAAETEKLLLRIRKRFAIGISAEAEVRAAAADDDSFYNNDQWPAAQKAERIAQGRPFLTVNKLPQYVKQVTNEMRQNRPQIRVLPRSDGATEKVAKKISGILRHIQVNSRADLAYDSAAEQTVVGGYGYWRVRADYAEDGSFDDQELIVERIQNRFSVVLDPSRQQPDGSDIKWGFIFSNVPKEDFEAEYPDEDVAGYNEAIPGNLEQQWIGDETIKLAEYFEVEIKPKEKLILDNNAVVWRSDYREEDGKIVKSRMVNKRCVYWYKTNGHAILDESEWPGSLIPIVIEIGDEIVVNGKVNYKGLVRNAKDPQQMVNYWWTAYTEYVALMPKAPFIGYVGQFADPQKWEEANQVAHPYLEVNPVVEPISGTLMPMPQRQQFTGVPTGIAQGLELANNDMKETTGIYQAGLGQKSNETSGKAINARKEEGDTGNFHFMDNQTRALRHCGRILLEAFPHYYDTARIVRILGEDGNVEEMLPINGHPGDDPEQPADEVFDMRIGTYDVVVDVGPSYSTKRQEAAQSMTEFIRVFPQAAAFIGDLVAKAQDWPGSEEIAERLHAMLPPQLLQLDKQGKLPPEVQAMIAGMQGQIQQMGQQLQQQAAQLNSEEQKIQLEKYKVDENNATAFAIAKLKASPDEPIQMVAREVLELRAQLEQMGQTVQAPAPMPNVGMDQGPSEGPSQAQAQPQPQAQPDPGANPPQSMGTP